jgi:NAD(P)-dependent dehydrogenase (short-subunit alcohol dehydrogenase family)
LSAAQDLARLGITVNVIAPGGFWSPLVEKIVTRERYEGALTHVPIPRSASEIMEAVASAAVFLAADESDYITGQVLGVDGGYFPLWTRPD